MNKARTFLALTSAALGACSTLLSGDFTGGSPTTGGPGPDAAPEGAAEGGSSGGGDSGAPGADADAGPFCASRPGVFFCDDFDDRLRPYQQVWPDESFDGTASVTLATDHVTSPPNSLLIVSNPGGGGLAGVSRTITWPAPVSAITVEASIFIEAFAPESTAETLLMPVFLSATPALDQRGVRVHTSGGGATQQQEEVFYPADGGAGVFLQDNIAPAIAVGRWVRLVRHIVLGSAPRSTLSADGVVISPMDLSTEFGPATTTATVFLGFQYTSGPTSAVRIWTDDVVVDGH